MEQVLIFSPKFSKLKEGNCPEQIVFSTQPLIDLKYVGLIQGLHGLVKQTLNSSDISSYETSNETVFISYDGEAEIYFCLKHQKVKNETIPTNLQNACNLLFTLFKSLNSEAMISGSKSNLVDGSNKFVQLVDFQKIKFYENTLTGAIVSSVNALAIIEVLELMKDQTFCLFYGINLVLSNYSSSNEGHFGSLLHIHELLALKNGENYKFYGENVRIRWKENNDLLKIYVFGDTEEKNVDFDTYIKSEQKLDDLLNVFVNSEACTKFSEHVTSGENSGYSLVYSNSLTPYKKSASCAENDSSDSGWLHEFLEKNGGGCVIARSTKVLKKEYQFYFGESQGGRTVAVGKVFCQSSIQQAENGLRDIAKAQVGSVL